MKTILFVCVALCGSVCVAQDCTTGQCAKSASDRVVSVAKAVVAVPVEVVQVMLPDVRASVAIDSDCQSDEQYSESKQSRICGWFAKRKEGWRKIRSVVTLRFEIGKGCR